jgi:hypothetical protein
MPKQSIEVFCKYEADDSVAPLGHDGLSRCVEEDRERTRFQGRYRRPSEQVGHKRTVRVRQVCLSSPI